MIQLPLYSVKFRSIPNNIASENKQDCYLVTIIVKILPFTTQATDANYSWIKALELINNYDIYDKSFLITH